MVFVIRQWFDPSFTPTRVNRQEFLLCGKFSEYGRGGKEELERTKVKAITGLLTKAAGLVFFAFLAISLGVIFGYLFEDWVKEGPGTAVQAPAADSLEYPLTVDEPTAPTKQAPKTPAKVTTTPPAVHKVKVGPFASREEASKSASKLETAGYPVYVSTQAPFTVQVGAFSSQENADRLKGELKNKGFTAFVQN